MNRQLEIPSVASMSGLRGHLTVTYSQPAHAQRGAVLFVALVFLVLITLLALTASSTSVLQERMTGGMRNAQLGLMGSESALRSVEYKIWTKSEDTGLPQLNCGFYGIDDACYATRSVSGGSVSGFGVVTAYGMNRIANTFRSQRGWPAGTACTGAAQYTTLSASSPPPTAALKFNPCYIIELMGAVLPPGSSNNGAGGAIDPLHTGGTGNQTLYSYRITARSPGGNAGSARATESYFLALPPSH